MTDVAALIAELIEAGVAPMLVGRVSAALAEREAVLVPDEAAERRRAADRERKRLRKSAEVAGIRGTVSPKETTPAPPKEITLSSPTTQKENPPKGGQKKGSRLPSDFAPDLVWATGQGLSFSQAETEAARFADFWRAKPGAGGLKLDWEATWRNWVRSAKDRLPPHSRAGPKPGSALDAAKNLLEKLDAVSASQVERNSPPLRLVAFSGDG